MKHFIPSLIILSALLTTFSSPGQALTRRPAKVAVIQATGSPRQDPFLKTYDPAKVRPMMEAHLKKLLRLLERAGEMKADIVCGPEDMQNIGAYGLYIDVRDSASGEELFNSLAEPVPGPLTGRISIIARKYGMYIVAPIYEREGGKVYNSAVIFDREGKIIGKHHKTHLPILETWDVERGDVYEVFETDFASIAVATCFEIVYPEISTIYALKGADIIFHPTMGRENKEGQSLATGHRYLTRAADNLVYVAPIILGTDGCGIIDFKGNVIAEAVGARDTVIMAEIDFSKEPVTESKWWTTINGTDNDRAIHYLTRRPEIYNLLTNPSPPLLERYRDVRLTTGDREKQLKAVKAVNYGP